VRRYGTFGSTDAPNRDQLDLPGTLVQGFSQLPVEICRPSFDALWNSAGLAKWTETAFG
jgi:hypothetical protein